MNDGLVSVIVPTYNRAYCICRAIDSVRAQTVSNWEVVIVDDGSTDNTAELIASKYGDDPRIRYVPQPNGGVSNARNTGIRASRGDYVALLDSDDQWKPWKLAVQLACFKFFPNVGMVWTDFEAVNSSGVVVHARYLRKMYEAYRFFPTTESLLGNPHPLAEVIDQTIDVDPSARVFAGNIYTSMLRGNLVHTSTVMLSRDRISKVKGFDESLVLSGEDYDFHFRTCKWGDVCFVDLASTIYQLGFDDRLTKHSKQIALNFLKTVKAAIDRESGTNQFPPVMISEVLTEANGWVAEEYFKAKDYPAVRRHAVQSLKHKPWQPRLISLLGLASVPAGITNGLLRTYRRIKPLPGAKPD